MISISAISALMTGLNMLISMACSDQTYSDRSPAKELPLSSGIERFPTSGTAMIAPGKGKVYVWQWAKLDDGPREYTAGDGRNVSWSEGRVLFGTTVENCVHVLRSADAQTEKNVDFAKLGREWYVAEMANSQNGKYQAILLDFDAMIGDVPTALTDQSYYGLGVVNLSIPDSNWVRPIVHKNRGGTLTQSALAVSEDGEYVAVVGCDGTGGWIHVASPRQSKCNWECVPDDSNAFGAVAFAPDGKLVYAAGTDGDVYAFETLSGRPRSRWAVREGKEIAYGERITSLAASLDGQFVAAGLGPTGDVYLWSTNTGKVVASFLTGQATIYGLAFSPDSRFLATHGVRGNTIRIWQVPRPPVKAAIQPGSDVFEMIRSGKTAELSSLLDLNPKLTNARDQYGRTLLHWAVTSDNPECARKLCKLGADVDAKDKSGRTPLHHWAAGDGNRDLGNVLLDNGADYKAKTKSSNLSTAMHLAAVAGRVEVLDVLISRDANINVCEGHGFTPLHFAADYGQTAVVKLLLRHKSRIDLKSKYGGQLPIHLAAERGHAEIVSLLLAAGTNVNALNDYKQTPLIVASEWNQPAVATILLDAGADLEFLTAHGRAIHIAARDGSRALMQLFLARGADANSLDRNGWTPLRWSQHGMRWSARQQEREDVQSMLQHRGAK